MIIQKDSRIEVKFGKGDVCIASGYTNFGDGFIIFKNQDEREIGSEGVICSGDVRLEDYPLSMLFSKIESIDVLIKSLELAKRYMLKHPTYSKENLQNGH